jgi:membrane associated rhomboid family serine protease
MIPIRDITPSKNIPVINNALIGINVVVFIIQMMQGPALDRFIFFYGLVPARYTVEAVAQHFTFSQQVLSWFTFMFLHGGYLHILSNMWFLYIFGDNVEDRLGPLRYIAFYLMCGVASGISHFALNAHSPVPTIGASGAVAGVMGAYFLLHPTSRILTLIPILIFPLFIQIPAFIFLGMWFLLQFIQATAAAGTGVEAGVAWWAHIGGFVFGMLFLKLFDALPGTGFTARVRSLTARKHSHRFQVPRQARTDPSADIYSIVVISPYEAMVGTHKVVSIPMGFQRRTYRVDVPAGIANGNTLRLRGQGNARPDGTRGDLLLKVVIQ